MEELEKLINITEEKLPDIKSLIIGIVALLGSFVFLDNFLNQFADLKLKSIIYSLFLFLWIGFWLFNKLHLPRNDKGKVGIVIAIFSENEEERQKFKADFISKLKNDLTQEGISNFSQVIFLKNHFSKKLKESNSPIDELKKINKKIRAHFYVWGDVKKRPDGEEGEKYFLSFRGYVIHTPISQNLSKEISRDFSKVLPREINFLENRSFKGFEASAKLVHLAAKYIIGIAAFVSHDPRLAFKLHNGLREQFNALRPLPPHLQDIRNRIPLLISDETLWIAKWHFQNKRISETKIFLTQSLSENTNNYGAWLFKAIIDFLADNNVNEAFRSVGKAEKYSNGSFEWRYSKTFLYFWNGDFEKALKLCQKIKQQSSPTDEIALEEVRGFNLNLLNNPNPKAQLYFWIGYLSYFKQNNFGNALEDFEKFEEFADENMSILKQKSSIYLREIKQKMSLK